MKLEYLIAAAVLLSFASCAKDGGSAKNEDEKRYFDAWISQNHPDAVRTKLGAYILSQTEGTGVPAGDSAFARIDYSSFKLNGDLVSTTKEKMARQCNIYSSSEYYGPYLAYRGTKLESMGAGLEEAVAGMKVGGKMTVVIPGWLSEAKRYDSEQKYLKNCSGTDYIYELELVDVFNDADKWEKDSLRRYMASNHPGAVEDADYPGFFYVQSRPGAAGKEFPSDTTFYINYTGRLLNGKVFDTTIADTAKVWGLYSSSSTYKQKKVTWPSSGQNFTNIQLADNDIIKGFAYAISKMHPGEAGDCYFVSGYGYSYSGSGKTIPSCSPLSFYIETTEAP